jgi:ABC-type amino acid transport substrate-binding protein
MKKLLLLLLLCSATAYAQVPTSTVPLPHDIAAIKRANVLVVSMTKKDNAPFFSGDEQHLHGIDVDIANSIGKALKVPVKFRRDAESFAEVVEQVRDGRADIAVSKVSVTEPRLETVKFSTPYLKLRQAMIVNRVWLSQNTQGREIYQVIRDFHGRISFIKDSSYDTFARINFPNAQFIPKEKWDDIVTDVMSGRVAAAYRDEFELKKISFERPDAALSTKTITISDKVDFIAIAVNNNAQQLLPVVNHVIRNEYSNLDANKLMIRYKEEKALKDAK